MQERQEVSTSQPPETTPISTTAPPTTTEAVLPMVPSSRASTSASKTTTVPDTNVSMEEMMKEIKALELQMPELKEAKEKLAKLEVNYDKSKVTVAEKTRKVKAMENKIKSLEKDLTLHKTLAEMKTILWTKIG